MSKSIGAIAAVVVLAGAGYTGASYWSGMQAERWYQEDLTDVAASSEIKLKNVSYERGLFSSQAITRIEFQQSEGESDASFSIRQDIYHGPLPLAGQSVAGIMMEPCLAVTRTTLETESGEWTRELAKLYGNKEPVVAISKIGFDGASDNHVEMLPLELNDFEDLQSLKFSGLHGYFHAEKKNTAIHGNLNVSNLEVVGKPEDSGKGTRITLRDLTTSTNQNKGAFDLLFGDTHFKLGELEVHDPNSDTQVTLKDLSATGSLTQQNTKQVAAEVSLNAEEVMVDQESGAGSLKLTLRNLDGVVVQKLQNWQEKVSNNPNDTLVMMEGLPLLSTLLDSAPEIALETQGKAKNGEWQGTLTLNLQNPGDVNPALGMNEFLKLLGKSHASITASQELVEAALTQAITEELKEQDATLDDETLQKMAAKQMQQRLQGFAIMGFIQLENGQYKSSAHFENGKLYVNNQEVPLM